MQGAVAVMEGAVVAAGGHVGAVLEEEAAREARQGTEAAGEPGRGIL